MSNALTRAATSVTVARLVGAFLSNKSQNTVAAYAADLRAFAKFVCADDVDAAANALLRLDPGVANAVALEYRADLVERGLSASTVNRRLASLRSLVALARTLGLVTWELQVKNLRAEAYRDTRGPGFHGFVMLLAALEGRRSRKATRDRALLRLLFDLALRRGEVVSLDAADVDLVAGSLNVLGKGRNARVRLTLPEPTKAALAAWLEVRGFDEGPLFTNVDRAGKGKRLTGRSVHRIVTRLGKDAGVAVRPHGLRHAAITSGLDATNGDVRAVQRFSRHKSLATLTLYDDCRRDLAGKVARMVASKAPGRRVG